MYLSFDVGIKHLGFAWLDASGWVVHTGVRGIPTKTNRIKDTIETLRKLMQERSEIPSVVLVEKQLHRNPTMRVVQAILQTFYVLEYPGCKVLEYSPKKKLKGEECANYRARKKRSVELCSSYLETHANEDARSAFRQEKKKDDMADAILQALSYLDKSPSLLASIGENETFWDETDDGPSSE